MSALDTLKTGLKYVEPLIETLAAIQKITGTGGMPAEEMIAAVNAAIKSFVDGVAGDASPASILADLASLTKSEVDDDAAADAALKAKFPDPAP